MISEYINRIIENLLIFYILVKIEVGQIAMPYLDSPDQGESTSLTL